MAEDTSPPVLTSSASTGFIEENSLVGTSVKDVNGNDITFRITDSDHVSQIKYQPLSTDKRVSSFFSRMEGTCQITPMR